MDNTTWAALTATLTLLGILYTSFAYRRRGWPAALRGAGLTLLPIAAYLTNTLQMFTEIGESVATWATGLVFRPTVWVGVVLAGLGVLLFGAGRWLGARTEKKAVQQKRDGTGVAADGRAEQLSAGDPHDDDDLADIEAILKKRGIE